MPGILNLILGGVGVVKDAYFNLVSLLLPGNGTNGAQNNTFLDSSTNNFTITRNGNTTQGTFSPFSQTGWGASFSGSNQLTLPSALALAPEAGQFCIEFWIYPTASWGSVDRPIFVTAGSGGLWVGWQATAFVLRAYGVTNHLTYGTAPTLNTWTHVAICRNSGNTTSMYFNGSRVATGTVTQNFAQAISYVGSDTAYGGSGAALLMASNLSNLRLVKGSSVYDPTQTSITVPTSPLTAITNTTLLICQSNRFVDNSTANSGSGWTVTSNGNVTITSFSPFAPTAAYTTAAVGGSGYFDGTGDYLTAPSDAAWSFGTGDFTVEAWIYQTGSLANYKTVAGNIQSGSDTTWYMYVSSTGTLKFQSWNLVPLSSTATLNLNSWNHVVAVRSGTDGALFLNGTRVDTESSFTQNFSTNATLYIGRSNPDNVDWAGYISGLRIVKGSSVYDPTQTTITVPTAPLTAVSGTSLLLNFTNAGVVDATAKNVLETVGNAQISTTQSKWGGSSIYLDGTGDYLITKSSDLFSFGTGDFTVEFWTYLTNSGNDNGPIFDTRSTSTNGLLIRQGNGGGGIANRIDAVIANTSTASSGTISFNTWIHVAVVRSSGTLKVYYNGTGGAGVSATGNLTGTNAYISAFYDNVAFNVAGYFSDIRVTKGLARYTANFTAPTAPFPVQ